MPLARVVRALLSGHPPTRAGVRRSVRLVASFALSAGVATCACTLMTTEPALASFPTASARFATRSFTVDFASMSQRICLGDSGSFASAGLVAVFSGYGSQCITKEHGLMQQPAAPSGGASTHAALSVTERGFRDDFVITANYVTQSQLRATPNPWEVGWVLVDYVNVNHFYGVILQPNGWEVEKEWCNPGTSPCQSQQFLATGTTPVFPPGRAVQLRITQTVANGIPTFVVSYAPPRSNDFQVVGVASDTGAVTAPYVSGKVGLYDEEASVEWLSLSVQS
jgi:hypothetical protein